MKIDEVVFTSLPEPTQERLKRLHLNSKYLEDVAGIPVYVNQWDNPEQEAYLYVEDNIVIGYLILQKYKLWSLEELWIAKDFRNKKLAQALIIFAKDQKGRLLVDYRQSPAAYSLVKKMLDNEIIQARIVDLKSGDAEDYNHNTDLNMIKHKTFLLEDYSPRLGMLSPLTIIDYFSQIEKWEANKRI